MRTLLRIVPATLLAAALLFGQPRPAAALLQAHLDYAGCSMCHVFHSATPGTPLLAALTSESLCLSCHGEASAVATVAAVHNPLGKAADEQGYITCRECHDAHEYVGTPNIKMIGYECDPETQYGCDNGPAMTGTPPVIRVEHNSTTLAAPLYRTVTYTGTTDFNIDGSFPGPGACQVCHAPNHNVGQDCTACHPHAGGFLPSGGSCVACHDGTDINAPVVTYNSAHSKNTLFAVTSPIAFDCVACHGGHGAGTIEIANNTAVGIDYSLNGEAGISLGSATVTGSIEAEICWNCHITYGVSEWGTNSGGSYDYGSLHDSAADATPSPGNHLDWTTGFWRSADFGYKDGPLNTRPVAGNANPGDNAAGRGSASIHATAGTVGTPSDAIAEVSCTYCHDVHDTMGPSGKPYLRGSWAPNPFPEDGAPRAGQASYASSDFGGVPRGGTGTKHPLSWAGNNKPGGWQIEQNNSDFSWAGYAAGASLCFNCHTPAGIEAASAWTGHNAVVPGFGGSDAASNIFTTTRRGGNGTYLLGHMRHANTTAYDSAKGWVYGLRSAETGSGQNPPLYGIVPNINPSQPQAGANLDLSALLGITVDAGTTDTGFHAFPCSKCHTPHASRLPRLMITNCLNVANNTWDDAIDPTTWTPIAGTNGHTATQLAYASSATNCHRYVGATDPNRETTGNNENGWNSVTPW